MDQHQEGLNSDLDPDLTSLMSILFGHDYAAYGTVQPSSYPYYNAGENELPFDMQNIGMLGEASTSSNTQAYSSMSMPLLSGSPRIDGMNGQLQPPGSSTQDYAFSTGFEFMSPQTHMQQLPEASSSSAILNGALPEGSNKRRRGLSTSGGDDHGNSPTEYDEKHGTGVRASKACGECRKASQSTDDDTPRDNASDHSGHYRSTVSHGGRWPTSMFALQVNEQRMSFPQYNRQGKCPQEEVSSIRSATDSLSERSFSKSAKAKKPESDEVSCSPSSSTLPARPVAQQSQLDTSQSRSTIDGMARSTQRAEYAIPGCLLSESDATPLFELFFESLNVRWALLHRDVHTISFCRNRSPFLYNTICFISSCYSIPHTNLRKGLSDAARTQAMSIHIISTASLESVQAYLLLSLWGTGYGRRDEYDRAWTMVCFACRMALDLQLFHASWKNTPHHIAERAWILCCVIDQTKSAQRGRIKSISIPCDASVSEAYTWLSEEPECILLVFYADLLHITQRALGLVTDMPRDGLEFSITVQMYERQATSWLARYQNLHSTLHAEDKIGRAADRYMSYLAEFYVSYWSLAISSFAFQHALNQQSIDLPHYITTTTLYALRALKATETELQQDSPVRMAPDGHFEFILHAAVFVLKTIHYDEDHKADKHALIERVARLVAAVSRNQRDTPALYAALLLELSAAVKGSKDDHASEEFFAPAISSQTKEFAQLLLQSSMWKSVIFPGLNGGNVESLDSK